MTEFSLSSTTTSKKTHFSGLLLSDIFLFCSFVLSHPLYFSYFIFFFPYLFKLLSFLSPLFITTSLLLLAFLTISPGVVHDNSDPESTESNASSVFSSYTTIIERLWSSKVDHGNEKSHDRFEELEVYKIVFEIETASSLDVRARPDEVLALEAEGKYCSMVSSDQPQFQKSSSHEEGTFGQLDNDLSENLVVPKPGNGHLIAEEKRLEDFLSQKKEMFESCLCEKGEEQVKPPSVKSDKVEKQKEHSARSGSKAMSHNISEAEPSPDDDGVQHPPNGIDLQTLEAKHGSPEPTNGGVYGSKATDNSQTLTKTNLGSFGSMRKEKEWRRTLACKLFEERHNVDVGGEGMDLLWETYEKDSLKLQAKSKTKKGKKLGSIDYFEEEEEEEEEEEKDGQLCCLQALKFSAGKMNLGMGRPNLVKISKALRGIGWLHHVSRHGKKGSH